MSWLLNVLCKWLQALALTPSPRKERENCTPTPVFYNLTPARTAPVPSQRKSRKRAYIPSGFQAKLHAERQLTCWAFGSPDARSPSSESARAFRRFPGAHSIHSAPPSPAGRSAGSLETDASSQPIRAFVFLQDSFLIGPLVPHRRKVFYSNYITPEISPKAIDFSGETFIRFY